MNLRKSIDGVKILTFFLNKISLAVSRKHSFPEWRKVEERRPGQDNIKDDNAGEHQKTRAHFQDLLSLNQSSLVRQRIGGVLNRIKNYCVCQGLFSVGF